jgi:hypothetical protein
MYGVWVGVYNAALLFDEAKYWARSLTVVVGVNGFTFLGFLQQEQKEKKTIKIRIAIPNARMCNLIAAKHIQTATLE